MNTTTDINYIYPNYDIAHGGVKDGLIRIAKIDMSIEIYWHGSWHKCTTYQTPPPADEVTIADTGGYYSSDNVEGALQEIGSALDGVETELGGI